MHKSPSLFFDILVEDDESKRNEKIKRASFEIKNTFAVGSPASPTLLKLKGKEQCIPQHVLQQNLLATAGGISIDSTSSNVLQPATPAASCEAPPPAASGDYTGQQPSLISPALDPSMCGSQQQQQQQQQQQEEQQQLQPPLLPQPPLSQLVLTPQEVLQELLGDLYISQDRLVMGALLGQGGFADVHQAELVDPVLGFTEAVAVKRLRPDVLKGPDDLKEFLTEANLLRKLKHRNIVQLRGVGASDLSDLVAMRESMFVVQEFMAGGDLKQLVMTAMARPFDPGYSKVAAFNWAMQIAEAMHYLHCVCCPMIIHRDLKLDNVLLTGDPVESRTAKLADFGLHKRVRKMVASGTLVAWNQETTYHGIDYERSYYGGNTYLMCSAMSVAGSVRDEGSMHGSLGGSLHSAGAAGAALAAAAAAAAVPGSGQPQPATELPPLPAAAAAGPASNSGRINFGALKGPRGSLHGLKAPGAAAADGGASTATPSNQKPPVPSAAASDSGAMQRQQLSAGSLSTVVHSDSAASFQQAAAAAGGSAAAATVCDSVASSPGSPGLATQQQELLNVVRAKSQGLLEKQEFVTRVLSAAASRPQVLQDGQLHHNKEVSRTFAAVQALEGSVRAGNAFNQQMLQGGVAAVQSSSTGMPQQQQQNSSLQRREPEITAADDPAVAPPAAPGSSSGMTDSWQQQGKQQGKQQAKQQRKQQQHHHHHQELCPQLLEKLHNGLAAAKDSQKFLEATQKVGSLMYMAPEVLAGHQYNEKIDVFSYGIILYELMSGVVVAGRVAMEGQHDELLDYARLVANGHREALPSYWPVPLKNLISACWAQEPGKRPGFREILRLLYAMKQAGVDVELDSARPKGDYNPVTDCGCSIM